MKRQAYIKQHRESLAGMTNLELLEGFTVACNAICNAHNFTKHGPNQAMRAEYANFQSEIMSRMREA